MAVPINHWVQVFCKLAVAQGVVPRQNWSWDSFLRAAAKLLGFAFE
jgi:hypothetical protein